MLNLAPEIDELRESGALPADVAARLIARERREVFSIYPELRAMSWIGALLIATGVTLFLGRNVERLGPALLATIVAATALAAYAWAAWRRRTAEPSLVDEYVLLLGALLLSADLAYVESQFHLLDEDWPRHLLLAAVVHGVTAYVFGSRTLLSLSIAALAAWMGVEQRIETLFDSTTETALRALVCAAVVLMWRGIDARWRASRDFEPVFEHFAANLALAAGMILTFDNDTREIGTLLTVVVAAVVIAHGFRKQSLAFVIYGYVYAVIAIDVLVVDWLRDDVAVLSFLIASSIAAIAGLFVLHGAFRRRRT